MLKKDTLKDVGMVGFCYQIGCSAIRQDYSQTGLWFSIDANLFASGSGNHSIDKGPEASLSGQSRHGVDHLVANIAHLGVASVIGPIVLLLGSLNLQYLNSKLNVSILPPQTFSHLSEFSQTEHCQVYMN